MRFGENLLSAVLYLRSINVVHRDVKPGNILISHHDGQTIYKLAGFGAARFLGADETYGSLYGTFQYLHPEIFEKFYAKALDIRFPKQKFKADHELWSLGVAATGRLPIVPKNSRVDPEIMYRVTASKKNDCISAKEAGDGIQWSKELPGNCNLDHSLKQIITPI